jgi:2-oxo-4-hydroxy-4-carboxy--5-ureidoimidazoline (OHCU) decarboxylase
MTSLPAIGTLSHLDDSELKTVLDLLFEPSPPLHALSLPVLRTTTFADYTFLIAAVNAQLTALAASDKPEDVEKLSEILCSHPRLGEKKVDSEQSRKEQAQLQQGPGAEEEGKKLAELNREYEEKFPGLRYVYVIFFMSIDNLSDSPCSLKPLLFDNLDLTATSVFVNGRSRPVVMENMRARIDRGDIKAERQEAIQVCCS